MVESGAVSSDKSGGGNRVVYGITGAVLLACVLVYGMALNGPLFFDDLPNLLDNELVQIDGYAFDDWRVAALSSNAGLFYRPVAMLTFALNHVVAGSFTAVSLKMTNLAIHLAIAGFVYCFARAVLQTPALAAVRLDSHQRRVVAIIAASIWLLLPIHVSTVLYTIQRMAQLSSLFVVAGLLLFSQFRLRWAESGASAGELIAACLWLLLLGALAVLSKENGALLPWLMGVLEVTLFRGVWRGQSSQRLVWLGWGIFALPIVLLTVLFLISPEVISGRFGGREFSLEERLLTQCRVLWRYLGWILLPNITDMGFFHDDIPLSRGLWSPSTAALSLLAWVGAIVVALLLRRRHPLLLFALFFYLVAHSMESTIIPLEMVFEHRNYLPSIGVCLLLAVVLYQFAARFERLRLSVVLYSVLSVLVVLLAIRTHAWSDETTLARYNVINHPESPRANFFYANALFKRFERAEELRLDEEEQRALAVTSRYYFKRMHSIDERDFAALVMLYQLDTIHFPGLSEENDWLGALEVLVKIRRLQASDRTALDALVDFSGTAAGEAGHVRVSAMLDQLAHRYPAHMAILALRYKLVVGSGKSDSGELLESLELAARVNPHGRQAAAYLAQYHGSDNIDMTYEAIRDWMQRDTRRRELSVIRRIFDN